ncbi:MAG: hypothetical protein OIF40_16960 [Mangrovicoccus sp.]|nr:hypothetical protein [Mangrovicoccus sp.]
MHPNMQHSTDPAASAEHSDRMNLAQIALLAGVWAAFFAIGAWVMS